MLACPLKSCSAGCSARTTTSFHMPRRSTSFLPREGESPFSLGIHFSSCRTSYWGIRTRVATLIDEEVAAARSVASRRNRA